MESLNQKQLDQFVSYLKNHKFRNKILNLNLEHCTDDDGDYIFINRFLIKKNVRRLGYGSAIIYNLIKVADEYNVRIVFNLDVKYKPLQEFYLKNGFVLIKKDSDYFVYFPK